ncbi:MAG: cytochrome c peroxidase [Pirellulaceae bacterium]
MLRRPVALDISADGKRLYTANRDSGSVSVIDCVSLEVQAEISVGGRLADISVFADGEREAIVVLDEAQSELLVLCEHADGWVVSSRTAVATSPVRLIASSTGEHMYVTSLWSRTLSAFEFVDFRPVPIATTDLPFEPRELCLTPDGEHLIVASAFGGQIASVDATTLEQVHTRSILGHNIRSLAFNSQSELLLTCQQLNPIAHSTRDDVHWGNMIANLLVSIPAEQIVSNSADLDAHCVFVPLGEPGEAAGDPGALILGREDKFAVLLSGVQQVGFGNVKNGIDRRTQVDQRPIAAVQHGEKLFVANQFSDSVTVIDWNASEQATADSVSPVSVSLGPQPVLTQSQIGEQLFYDSQLALDGWMSCHSCHTDGHTNGMRNDNLSDGAFGDPKQVPSLLGVGETGPWGWNGSVKSLEEQVLNSIQNTMRGDSPSQEQVAALVAFMKQLPAPPKISREKLAGQQVVAGTVPGQVDLVAEGERLVRSLDCVRCHVPPTFTSPNVYDVGLTDAVGNLQFNPPSLRGVQYRRSFFHDGRADSLKEVLTRFQHQLEQPIEEHEVLALLEYLLTL